MSGAGLIPPGRSEPKYRLRPSLEISGVKSMNGEFTAGPRLVGADHAELWVTKGCPGSGSRVACSVPQARRSARAAPGTQVETLIVPPRSMKVGSRSFADCG